MGRREGTTQEAAEIAKAETEVGSEVGDEAKDVMGGGSGRQRRQDIVTRCGETLGGCLYCFRWKGKVSR